MSTEQSTATNTIKSIVPLVSGMLSASQAEHPERLFDVLIVTAVKESWINLLIHFHTAIFFGLILLASGYDGVTSITYLAIHLSASLVSSVILVLLVRRSPEQLMAHRKSTVYWLTLSDVLTSLSWGSSILLFFVSSSFDQANTLVVLMLAAGISSAALSAKLIHILILGRILVFMPAIVLLIIQQPPDWLLHMTSLTLSFGVCVGVGYAIHVQLLREASVMVQLTETQDQIVREAEFRERFLKSITHDLRQPLTSLKLHLHSLQKQEPELKCSEEIQSIHTCLNSANQIMRNVSQLAWVSDTLPTPKLRALSLQPLFERVVASAQPIAMRKGLRLSMVNTSLVCMSEQSYMERILRNLVDNAIEHTQVGRILIGARNRSSIGEVEIQVLDTGCGIDKSEWLRVFKQYQRLNVDLDQDAEHLGLGLSIVQSICDAIGGSTTLHSEPGKGSCFGVRLKKSTVADNSVQVLGSKIKSVLVVDDDQAYAKQLGSTIAQLGFKCQVIFDLRKIDDLFDDGLPKCDYYMIDYHLSETRNGLDLIKLAPPHSTQLLISNFDNPRLKKAESEKNIAVFPKPQGVEAMRRFIAQQIGVLSRT